MKLTSQTLREMKRRGEKIAALTAYDFVTAQLEDAAGVPLILVGDSLGMVVLGYENTRSVTMEEMLHHTRAVARAKPQAMVIGDMPCLSYETSEQAVTNAQRFMEAGADGVKLEGGKAVLAQVRAIVGVGIPVLGHIGLLPQSATSYKLQGRSEAAAAALVRDARLLEDAGAFGVVLECVVASVAREVSQSISIPTIGIGSGADCDGQILVSNDMLGLFTGVTPKHARRYANLVEIMRTAFTAYKRDVETKSFPASRGSY